MISQNEFVFLLYASYPLALIYRLIWPLSTSTTSTTASVDNQLKQKSWFIFTVGASIAYLCYGPVGMAHFLSSALYSYFALLWMCRNAHSLWINGQKHWIQLIPALVSVCLLIHLSICHIYRQLFNPMNAIDPSGPMMIIIVKLSSLSWNVYDGVMLELLDSSADDSSHDTKAANQMIRRQKRLRYNINSKQFPSLLEFMAFMFFFPTFLTGPSVEFADFRQSCLQDDNSYFVDTEHKKDIDSIPQRSNRIAKGLKRLVLATFFALISLVTDFAFFESDMEFDKLPASYSILRPYLYSDNIGSMLLRIYAVMWNRKARLYFVWILADGACTMMGVPDMWNVHVPSIELAPNFAQINRRWNRKIHEWLKEYVYLRALDSGSLLLTRNATILTYMVSAFWHGFYPGYYLLFVTGALLNITEVTIKKKIWPRIPGHDNRLFLGFVYMVQVIGTAILLNYVTLPFTTLDFWKTLEAWKHLYYFGHMFIAIVLLAGMLLKPARSASQHHHKTE